MHVDSDSPSISASHEQKDLKSHPLGKHPTRDNEVQVGRESQEGRGMELSGEGIFESESKRKGTNLQPYRLDKSFPATDSTHGGHKDETTKRDEADLDRRLSDGSIPSRRQSREAMTPRMAERKQRERMAIRRAMQKLDDGVDKRGGKREIEERAEQVDSQDELLSLMDAVIDELKGQSQDDGRSRNKPFLTPHLEALECILRSAKSSALSLEVAGKVALEFKRALRTGSSDDHARLLVEIATLVSRFAEGEEKPLLATPAKKVVEEAESELSSNRPWTCATASCCVKACITSTRLSVERAAGLTDEGLASHADWVLRTVADALGSKPVSGPQDDLLNIATAFVERFPEGVSGRSSRMLAREGAALLAAPRSQDRLAAAHLLRALVTSLHNTEAKEIARIARSLSPPPGKGKNRDAQALMETLDSVSSVGDRHEKRTFFIPLPQDKKLSENYIDGGFVAGGLPDGVRERCEKVEKEVAGRMEKVLGRQWADESEWPYPRGIEELEGQEEEEESAAWGQVSPGASSGKRAVLSWRSKRAARKLAFFACAGALAAALACEAYESRPVSMMVPT